MKLKWIVLGLTSIICWSCQHYPIIHSDPTIIITKAESGDIYQNNDTIHVKMDINEDDSLVDASLLITSITDTFLIHEPNVAGLSTYSIDTFWVLTGMVTGVDAVVTATASNIHNGTTIRNIPIFLVP